MCLSCWLQAWRSTWPTPVQERSSATCWRPADALVSNETPSFLVANPHFRITSDLVSQGVLTKPDRLPPGSSIKECRRILRGEIFHLGHGYFVTKQPSQLLLDRGITHAEARMDESRFFETTEPWKSEFAEFKDRFGTSRLQTALSHKLTAQILSRYIHMRRWSSCDFANQLCLQSSAYCFASAQEDRSD